MWASWLGENGIGLPVVGAISRCRILAVVVLCNQISFCIFVFMKIILFFLLLPVFGYSQVYQVPQPEVAILRVDLKKDTLFVYRHVRWPPHNMSVTREWLEYNDREVYVVGRRREIVLLAVERAKIRKVKVEAEEEYW